MPPQTQPLIQQGDVTYLGSFTLPASDGSGAIFPQGSLTYGGVAGEGRSPNTLIYAQHSQSNSVCEVTIPTLGTMGSIVTTWRYMPMNASFDVPPSAAYVGGAIVWNGRVLVTGYVGYDNNPSAPYSWFTFDATTFAQSSRLGPFSMSPTGGLTGQYLGVIPTEWRSLLGGSHWAGASSLSIITRSSRGPVFAVFNPDDIGPSTALATRLLHYQPPATMPTPPGYVEADSYGGGAFPTGWRSVLYIRRHGDVHCYGTGAECNDPTDSSKGNHAYPYRHEICAYDANDLLAVKNGSMLPTAVVPYATWTVTDMLASAGGAGYARMKSSWYDIATRRWYITSFSGSSIYGSPRVHVYEIAAPSGPVVDCAGSWSDWTDTGVVGPCVGGVQDREETRSFTITTEPSGGGTACPTSPEFRTVQHPCATGARAGVVICG